MAKKVKIFIDESADYDNDRITLGAVIIPEKHLYNLNLDIDKIRVELTNKLMSESYPIFDPNYLPRSSRVRSEQKRLMAGYPVELHCRDLFNAEGAFSKVRDGTTHLFDSHLSFIESMLKLVTKYEIRYRNLSMSYISERMKERIFYVDLYTEYQSYLTKDVTYTKYQTILDDNFNGLLAGLLITLEEDSRRNNFIAEIICDKGKKNEFFRNLECFPLLRQRRYFMNFDPPKFEESHENNFIQLVDVATYIAHNASVYSNHNHKSLFKRLAYKYLNKALYKYSVYSGKVSRVARDDPRYILHKAISIETLFLHCGGMKKTYETRKATAFKLIDELLTENGKNGKGPYRKR